MRLQLVLGSACALLSAAVVQAQAPTPRTPQTGPSFPAPLYQQGNVGKSLNLTQDQINRLNKLDQQTQAQFRDQYGKLNDLTGPNRAARMQELNRQYNSDWMKGARDILNDKQLSRYQQLQMQYGGFNSLNNPDVQKRLNLTPEQRNNLRQSIEWSNQQLQDINRQAGTDREKGVKLYRDYQRQYQDRFNKFLTPDQLKSWQQMTGESFTFQPPYSTTNPRRP